MLFVTSSNIREFKLEYNFIRSEPIAKMNSQNVYSDSLKRMIGFKLFPNINPEQITIPQQKPHNIPTSKPNPEPLLPTTSKKTDQHMQSMKKQIIEARKKQRQFEKQIDKLVGKMIEKGEAEVVNKKIRKYGHSSRLRIITEPFQTTHRELGEAKFKLGKSKKLKTQYDDEQQEKNQRKQQKSSPREKEKWKITLKIQQNQQQKQPSLPRLNQRVKTEADLKPKKKFEETPLVQIHQAENANKLIKHYRAGMSSLKKLKRHKFD